MEKLTQIHQKAGASLIPVAKITKVPKVVKAIGNVGKTGSKKGKEGDKTVWKRFTQEDKPKPDKNKGNQSKAGSKSGTTTSKPNQEEASKSGQAKQTKVRDRGESGNRAIPYRTNGRNGKQTRLKEIAKDPKVSSALRGEIKRDINEIKRGKRKNIRVPRGYQMAHRRGFEARRGFGYEYSDLNTIAEHKRQHKMDNYGRGRKK